MNRDEKITEAEKIEKCADPNCPCIYCFARALAQELKGAKQYGERMFDLIEDEWRPLRDRLQREVDELKLERARNCWDDTATKLNASEREVERLREHFRSCGECMECVEESNPLLADALAASEKEEDIEAVVGDLETVIRGMGKVAGEMKKERLAASERDEGAFNAKAWQEANENTYSCRGNVPHKGRTAAMACLEHPPPASGTKGRRGIT